MYVGVCARICTYIMCMYVQVCTLVSVYMRMSTVMYFSMYICEHVFD